MTEPLPENVRRAGFDALQELSTRMGRGSASLLRHAARLLTDDAKSHREALAQLRRYQGFKMPCFEDVAVIEGALIGLTEAESKALSERRRLKKHNKDEAWKKYCAEVQNRHSRGRGNREECERLKSELCVLQARARALGLAESRPGQNGNVITGPWDTAG